MQAGAATLENSMEVSQKTKNRTILRPSNCTTRHLSTGYRCAVSKGHVHPHVYRSTINNSQSMKGAQMSINGWMDKEDVVYTYNGVLPSNPKEGNPAICNYVDGTGGYYAKWNQPVKERRISYVFTHMRNLRYKTDEHREGKKKKPIKTGRGTKQKRLLNMENKLRVTGGVVREGMG